MISTPSMKKTSSNRVYHEVKISCSQFVRFFLARDAQSLKRNFNGHVNHIIKLYLAGKLAQKDNTKTFDDFFAPPLTNTNTWHIHIYLHQTVYEKLKSQDTIAIKNLIERAIEGYIVFALNHPIRSEALKMIIKESYEDILQLTEKLKTMP